MGTKLDLISAIKEVINRQGISQNSAARIIYIHNNEDDDDGEICKFVEKFKKQLQRKTTSTALLKEYLRILEDNFESRRGNLIKSTPVTAQHLSQELILDITKLSRKLDLKSDA